MRAITPIKVSRIPRLQTRIDTSWKIIPEPALQNLGGLSFQTNYIYDVNSLQINNLLVFHRHKTVAKFNIRRSRLLLSPLFVSIGLQATLHALKTSLITVMFYPLPFHSLFWINQVYSNPLGLGTCKKNLFVWQNQK